MKRVSKNKNTDISEKSIEDFLKARKFYSKIDVVKFNNSFNNPFIDDWLF